MGICRGLGSSSLIMSVTLVSRGGGEGPGRDPISEDMDVSVRPSHVVSPNLWRSGIRGSNRAYLALLRCCAAFSAAFSSALH